MLTSWLRLFHLHALSPGEWQRLLERFGGPEPIADASTAELRSVGLDAETIDTLGRLTTPDERLTEKVESDLAWRDSSPSHHILTLADPEYPDLLRRISTPPPVLYLRGELAHLRPPSVALVGSRRASPYGREQATLLAHSLARNGVVVSSGLAAGIDACAHRGALRADRGTIAVLGNGVDVHFPPGNRKLQEQIAEQGLLLSEFARGTPPRASQFPRRNRIISGLGRGVVVVEGTLRSGSLITATQAGEQGREVMALPGSVRNPQSRGCHRLLRDGAMLVESAEDILGAVGLGAEASAQAGLPGIGAPVLPPALQEVLENLEDHPISIERLIPRTGMTLSMLSRALVQLEIRGRVGRNADGYWRQRVRAG